MTELVRTSAFRNGNDDEGATMIEEEAFITGSSEFPADIVAGGLEATLNRLVSTTAIPVSVLTFFFLFNFLCLVRN